jgi:hypothetical protein
MTVQIPVALEKVMLMTRASGARIIGIACPTGGVGAYSVAALLARGYAASGRRTVIVSTADELYDEHHRNSVNDRFGAEGDWEDENITVVRFAHNREAGGATAEELERLLSNPDYANHIIVVVWPPVLEPGVAGAGLIAAAFMCDAIFIVCATGVVTRSQLANCMEMLNPLGERLIGAIMTEHISSAVTGSRRGRASRAS